MVSTRPGRYGHGRGDKTVNGTETGGGCEGQGQASDTETLYGAFQRGLGVSPEHLPRQGARLDEPLRDERSGGTPKPRI
jgi:hypothetical protein